MSSWYCCCWWWWWCYDEEESYVLRGEEQGEGSLVRCSLLDDVLGVGSSGRIQEEVGVEIPVKRIPAMGRVVELLVGELWKDRRSWLGMGCLV